jgi:hypothetical protein
MTGVYRKVEEVGNGIRKKRNRKGRDARRQASIPPVFSNSPV